jgi:hypothetical protein
MKYIKKFEKFGNTESEKINEEMIFLPGALIAVYLIAFYQSKMPYLSGNPIKSLYRLYKMSRVLRKYKHLMGELDVMLKDDPTIEGIIRDIKKIGHDGNQTTPTFYVEKLKKELMNKLPVDKHQEVQTMIDELTVEVKEVGYDVYGYDGYDD